jgi:para-nitrobenzyl esterase
MLGANRDEAKLFMFANPKYVKRVLGLLPRYVIDEQAYAIQAHYASRMIRLAGTDLVARLMVTHSTEVYAYRFDWDELPTVFGAELSTMLGAAHGFEIPFVFGHFDLGREAAMLFPADTLASRQELAGAMMAYWGGFARLGKPAPESSALAAWTPFARETGAKMVFDTATGGGIRVVNDGDSVARLIADLEADERLAVPERCELLQMVAQRAAEFTPANYAARADCEAYPYRPRTEL